MAHLGRIASWFRRRRLDDQLREEIAQHIEQRRQALVDDGMDPRAAEQEARRRFGNVTGIREETRDLRSFPALDAFVQDVRFGARLIARRPGFAAAVVLTLALGAGLNGGLFLVFNASALRPAPLEDIDRVVRLDDGEPSVGPTYPDYADYRDRTDAVVLAASGTTDVVLSAEGRDISNERVRAVLASGNYFDVALVRPQIGRAFGPAEDRPHAAQNVAVLGDAFWSRRFNRDPSVVGSTITLNFVPFVVIGVLPPGFIGLDSTFRVAEVWVPLWSSAALSPGDRKLDQRTMWWGMEAVGRLKPGATLAVARAQLAAAAAELDRTYPGARRTRAPWLSAVTAFDPRILRLGSEKQFEEALFALVAGSAAFFILLIGCANVASLMLARASAREREIGIRLSLGAGRGRLVRQFLTESLLFSCAGTALGLVVAQWVLTFAFTDPARQPLGWSFAFDRRVLEFAVLLSLVTTAVSGLIPALLASRTGTVPGLKHGGPGRSSLGRLRSSFVGAEVTLCVVLVAATALFLRAAGRAAALDPVLPVEELLTIEVDAELHGYTGARRGALLAEMERRVAALPQVVSTSLVDNPPFGDYRSGTSLRTADRPDAPGLDTLSARVSRRFFETAGVPLLRGRAPEADGDIVVNETLARQLWADADPIGQRVTSGTYDRRYFTVVGVSRDVPYMSLRETGRPFFFGTINPANGARVLVRTHGPAARVSQAATAQVAQIDRTLTVTSRSVAAGLAEELAGALAPVRVTGMVGALALLLAAIGIAAVTSQVVVDRTHEIGVRMALGARSRDAVLMLIAKGLRPVAVGVLLGTAAAAAVARTMTSLLYGLSPADPIAFAGAALILTAAAVLAAYIPARRAAAVDPVIALRAE
jgi:predicted permease